MSNQEPVSLGWGRAAAMRFVKSEAEIRADIMKALEGKLSSEFQDYAQWQRVPTETEASVTSRPSTKTTFKPKTISSAVSSSKYTSVSSNCSTLCLHPWNKKAAQVDKSAEVEKNKRIAILSAQITTKKHSMHEYLKLRKMLRLANQNWKKDIIEKEANTHNSVTDLLEKFEKYSSAAIVLAEQHEKSVASALREYEDTKIQIKQELEKIEHDHNKVDNLLEASENDLQTLRTYKDKIYPEKVLTISKLQNNIQGLLQDQKDHKTDLNRIISGERNLLEMAYTNKAENVIEKAAENALEHSTISSIDDVAQNNISLINEIKIQRNEIMKLEKEILSLNEEVDNLRSMDQSNLKKHVFPEIFFTKTKCDPNDDIILDIPVRKFIPI